ncbi:MAG TPA: NrdH-redoxin [Spirochaetia bacterium]|nr:MAG: NrdH-redoxin [Spirochaetes bacterium GWB1_36_13]HCL56171.1 NrdH-redoxin [Spirochaetia bacterium]
MQIKLYTTPSCVYCRKAKDYFTSKKISFTELDVARNQQYAEEMVRKSGQMGVPVITIGNETIVGFDKPKIDRILNLN